MALGLVFSPVGAIAAKAPHVARDSHGRIARSPQVLKDFQKLHPCPATGKKTGACPGWVKDHVSALACGGKDGVENLQWQTTADAKAKDLVERKGC